MKILIDAMGGDHAPLEAVRGASLAAKEFDAEICLVGKEELILEIAKKEALDLSCIRIYNANDAISMEDPPISVRSRPESSLRVGFDLLKNGEVDAFVSAGSTGALHTGATLYVPKINNVRRSAIATVLPFETPVLLLDSGANISLTPEYMQMLGIMGSIYMKNLFGVENARVGLLNNGSESTKGTPLQTQAYELLSNTANINFIGNVEGNSVMNGICDVLVTDGFTGNVFLKTIEGMGKFFMSSLKPILKKKPLAALMIKKDLIKFKKQFDASEQGGAPLLGLARPVIKAHGSSDAKAIKNAVRGAIKMLESNIISKTDAELSIALEQNN